MKPGHCFTIEPMISQGKNKHLLWLGYINFLKTEYFVGNWRDVLWPDDWTAVTQDGKRSAQFEVKDDEKIMLIFY